VIGSHSADVLERAALDVTDEVMASYFRTQPQLMDSFDETSIAATRRDTRRHIDQIVLALRVGEPALFDDYLGWAEALFAGLGMPLVWLTGSVAEVASASEKILGSDAAPVRTLVDAALAALPSRSLAPAPSVAASGHLPALAVHYIVAAAGGRAVEAVDAILAELDAGCDPRLLFTEVLAPAQAEIGRLWQTGAITVAQEHYATAIAQTAARAIMARAPRETATGMRVLVAAVGDELHDMGARMVSDFFELAGWESVFIGANTPATEVARHARVVGADIVALSSTFAAGVPAVEEAVRAIGAEYAGGQRIPVIVGGRAFSIAPGLWERVGADGWAPDAAGGVRVAGGLVATGQR